MKMNEKDIENLTNLYNETKSNSFFTLTQKISPRYSNKLKKWIIKKWFKNNTTNNEKQIILSKLKSKMGLFKKDYKKIQLLKEISLKNKFIDFKLEVEQDRIFERNKSLINKELKQKNKELFKATIVVKKMQEQKNINVINQARIKRKKILIAKTNTRIKDLNEFLKNKVIHTKVFLSDEPPLTSIGWIKLFLSYIIILFWIAIIIWPIYELIKATLNDAATTYLISSDYKFGFDSINRLFTKTKFTTWLTNTIIIAGITSLITVFSTLLMGYAFSRFRFKGKKTSLLSVMLLQMVPTLAALTVFYVLFTILKASFNVSGWLILIIIYVGGGIAGNTFIMKGYMDSISTEIDEAAKIDGLSQWKIFTRIIIPLTKPMIALVALWSFIGPFGDYILPGLLLTEPDDFTLARGLRELTTDYYQRDQPAFAAGSIIVAVPISILFISLRKFLVGGITAGGVKG